MSQQNRRKALREALMMVVLTVLFLPMLPFCCGLLSVQAGIVDGRTKHDLAELELRNIRNALKLYFAKTGRYPRTAEGLRALVELKALEAVPVDPWGREYVYVNADGNPLITTYGRDGEPGGSWQNKDVSIRARESP
jgi:general secretion pathway protein G